MPFDTLGHIDPKHNSPVFPIYQIEHWAIIPRLNFRCSLNNWVWSAFEDQAPLNSICQLLQMVNFHWGWLESERFLLVSSADVADVGIQ